MTQVAQGLDDAGHRRAGADTSRKLADVGAAGLERP